MKISDLESLRTNLPRVPGIEGEEEYFSSVVLLLLIPVGGEYHILFEKRAASIRQGGEISFPGGEIDESDNSLEETAVREAEEEIGVPRDRIKVIGRLDTVFAPMGAMVNVVVGVSDVKPDEIKANPEEVEKAFLIPVSYFEKNKPERFRLRVEVHTSYMDSESGKEIVVFPAKELGLPERYWKSWGGLRHSVYVYRTTEGTIWGLTARIITDFVKHLPGQGAGS